MMRVHIPGRVGGCRKRRGVTMIEMVVLMTGVAAMLGLSAVLLQLLMKLDADSRARFNGASTAARLAEQFRRDIHSAYSAQLVNGPAGSSGPVGLKLEPGGDRTIEYQVKGNGIIQRLETRKASNPRRERYEIPHAGAVRLSLTEETGRRFATLALDRDVEANESNPPREFEVTALLGKNRSLVSQAAKPAGGKP